MLHLAIYRSLFITVYVDDICTTYRSSQQEVFLEKGALKICNKFKGEHPCRSVISIKLLWNHASAWVFSCKFAAYYQNTFFKNTSGRLLLNIFQVCDYHEKSCGLLFLTFLWDCITQFFFQKCLYCSLTEPLIHLSFCRKLSICSNLLEKSLTENLCSCNKFILEEFPWVLQVLFKLPALICL